MDKGKIALSKINKLSIINVKDYGVRGDGITDDTTAISNALNSNNKIIYFPSGTYKITNTITINSGIVKKVIGIEGTEILIALSSCIDAFRIYTELQIQDITFDFNHLYVLNGVTYNENCGSVKLKNVKFQNLKDTDSTTDTNIIYIFGTGNTVDIDGIEFNNILKRSDGVVDSGAGAVNCLVYASWNSPSASLNGSIKNVKVKDVHCIDASDHIVFDDTTGIYLANYNYSGLNDFVSLENINGNNFGKRLLKLDTRNYHIKNVYGYSDTDDTLCVIGCLNDGSNHVNVNISDVTIYGKMNMGITTACSDTNISNVLIDIQNPIISEYNNVSGGLGDYSYPILVDSNRTTINNATLKGYVPLTWNDNIEDLKVSNSTLIVPSTGKVCMRAPSGENNGFKNIELNNVTAINYVTTDSMSQLISTVEFDGTVNKRGCGLKIINCSLYSVGVNAYALKLYYIDDIDIVNFSYNNNGMYQAYRGIIADSCRNMRIENFQCNAYIDAVIESIYCDNVFINGLHAPVCTYNFITTDSMNVKLKNLDRSKIYMGTPSEYVNVLIEADSTFSTTANRPLANYQGQMGYDTTLDKPIWCKTTGAKEVDTLTITAGATSSGNVTITLNGVSKTVIVAINDTITQVCDKIQNTLFSHWIAGGLVSSTSVVFTKVVGGTNTAPTFNGGTTGVTGSFAITTAGTNPVWVDATGTEV